MLTTIQSAIADDLDAFEKTSWFTSVYLIMMSALGPLNGKLSSVFSPRLSIFVSSIFLAIGSVLTGFANSFNSFVIGRAVTGIGASGVFTVSIIIVLELTGSKRRGLGIGLLNSGYTFGVAVGATVAGALLPVIGWRALFWLQAPVALLGGLVLLLAIPLTFTAGDQDESEKEWSTWQRLKRLDYSGATTLTAALVLMLYALSAPKHIPIWPLVLSVMVAILFVSNEVYVAYDPIIPVTLLKSRGLLLTCLGTVGFMMARWSVLFYAPTYALAVRQWAPSSAGAMLIPTNAGFAAGGLLVGWLHVKRPGSFYFPTLVGYGLFPVTLAVLAALSKECSPAWAFILVVFLCGLMTGAALNYNLAHLLHITPKETHYVATALLATFRGFAGSFGAAIGGGLFTRTLDTSLKSRFADQGMERAALTRRLLGSPALVEQLDGVEKQIAIAGYQDALKLLWLSMALIAVAMLFVQAGTGSRGDAEKRRLREEQQGLLDEAQRE
ncbi:Vacuolar basic amino acid transporter 1 [Pseudocercospora fuligena]|uniref:Vacuolar basic amino acid transporter 1 n=1 Tax=Pseudocercospora fuligena TaxID=685502 RepID=A0A8H6VSC7_9PEZI|nr:Vacuolar basic amino acid transporter 1 [Pseudocercospora fuligena]